MTSEPRTRRGSIVAGEALSVNKLRMMLSDMQERLRIIAPKEYIAKLMSEETGGHALAELANDQLKKTKKTPMKAPAVTDQPASSVVKKATAIAKPTSSRPTVPKFSGSKPSLGEPALPRKASPSKNQPSAKPPPLKPNAPTGMRPPVASSSTPRRTSHDKVAPPSSASKSTPKPPASLATSSSRCNSAARNSSSSRNSSTSLSTPSRSRAATVDSSTPAATPSRMPPSQRYSSNSTDGLSTPSGRPAGVLSSTNPKNPNIAKPLSAATPKRALGTKPTVQSTPQSAKKHVNPAEPASSSKSSSSSARDVLSASAVRATAVKSTPLRQEATPSRSSGFTTASKLAPTPVALKPSTAPATIGSAAATNKPRTISTAPVLSSPSKRAEALARVRSHMTKPSTAAVSRVQPLPVESPSSSAKPQKSSPICAVPPADKRRQSVITNPFEQMVKHAKKDSPSQAAKRSVSSQLLLREEAKRLNNIVSSNSTKEIEGGSLPLMSSRSSCDAATVQIVNSIPRAFDARPPAVAAYPSGEKLTTDPTAKKKSPPKMTKAVPNNGVSPKRPATNPFGALL